MRYRVHPPSDRGSSVKDDWRAWLSGDKARVFRVYVQELEVSYSMLSVALNEAIGLWQEGRLAKSCLAVCVTPALCSRLSDPLSALLRSLTEHAQHYGTVPNTAPLDPANFQSARGRRGARMNGVLSRVLLSQRSQFLHKLSTLQEMVEDLSRDFRTAADELTDGLTTTPGNLWQTVDADHYDLNTCLREAIVLLKSFLIALPEDQVPAFQRTVQQQLITPDPHLAANHRTVRHRRMAAIAGE